MKRKLFLVATLLMFKVANVAAQCNFISPTVELNFISTAVPGFCDVNFNLSFEISQNGGNKYTFIHLWRTTDYQTWVSNPSYDAYTATQNKQPEFNDAGGESLNILQNALATIVLNNDNAPISFESSYGPDPDAPVKNPITNPGITVIRQIVGTNYRYTISNVVVRIPTPPGPAGCNSALSFTGDAWSSQSNNSNPPIHCSMLGWTYSINDVAVTGIKSCTVPLRYSIGLTTTQAVPFDVYYDVYVDDGDNVFNASLDYLVVNNNGPHSISSGSGFSGGNLSYDDPNSPYATISYKNNSIWYVVTAPTVFSNVVLYEANNSCATLPVNLTIFSAQRIGDKALLKWETATEINSRGFAIERLINGVWQEVAFVPSSAPGGNSTEAKIYQYSDPNTEKGTTQYRLRQVDLNLQSRYSEVRSVRGKGESGSMTVFPSPSATGNVSILFDDQKVNRSITVIDMAGRIVKQISAVSNNNITVSGLLPGTYIIRVLVTETGEQTSTKFLVISK